VSYGRSGSSTFQYTDKPADSATGLYYSNSRWYDPASGRFMTEDTYTGDLAVPLSLNRYIYAMDNPLRYTDPTGHYSELTSTTTYTVTTQQTFISTGNGYAGYYTIFTTITYTVSTTCYAPGECVSNTTPGTPTYSWVWTVVNLETNQICTSSSGAQEFTCVEGSSTKSTEFLGVNWNLFAADLFMTSVDEATVYVFVNYPVGALPVATGLGLGAESVTAYDLEYGSSATLAGAMAEWWSGFLRGIYLQYGS
jgi:RHS repeat-associated protein